MDVDRIRLDLLGGIRKDSVAGKPIDAFPDPRVVCPRSRLSENPWLFEAFGRGLSPRG
jgi:hypothetical protein